MPVSPALFGKVRTRRDFIAVATPRRFLSVWEQWLQTSMAASRESLRDGWNDAFLTAPIWRFWLGADICGASALGAFMPSMDGVGRYFPLTYVAVAGTEAALAPPEADARSPWFEQVEDFLLATLESRDHDDLLHAFENVASPAENRRVENRRVTRLDGDADQTPVEGQAFENSFALARAADAARAASSSTFWWTAGGEGFAPCAISCRRLPSPAVFTAMLTGRFEPGAP
ncbi:type VI secretion system-associated protein TagF [uncultured Rhodoblastus sp.]|uniref:type VI secretion system-associated protein TagF n=1 Tax=uncultured Rhodoblastus sp. TaxID=543037 RepID=UPI0025D3043F|nr:type VI secretion system-associated protein TagF [uncultured Rhodoblastus sp.]